MIDVANLQQKDYTELIKKVHEIIHENNFTVYKLGDAQLCNALGFGTSNRGNSYIVLEEDTAVELGAPRKDSVSMAMWTSATGTLAGRLWTYGRDFSGLINKSVSFLQIILLEFEEASKAVESDIGLIKNLINKIPGFMTRSRAGKIWIRIDKKLIEKGFSLYSLGQCLYKAYTDAIHDIKSMDIVLITDADDLINKFKQVSEDAKVIAGDNTKFKWISDGVVSCEELNCDTCEEKTACDTIKEILIKRKT
jgi:CO dehydrogenase/acetyl-CoA synthase beta subunit